MKKLPTAEEYIKEHPYIDSFLNSAQGYEVLKTFMIDFAKLHRKAILEAVSEKAKTKTTWSKKSRPGYSGFSSSEIVDKKSILNSYPEENIK